MPSSKVFVFDCIFAVVPKSAYITMASSTLIRFQTKTELFCSVFREIWAHTYSFRIVFARPHYNADQERSHKVASVCHFGYSRPTGLAPDCIYFDDVTVENSVFKKHRFQIAPLWRAFSNDSVFGDRFRRCSVDDSPIRSKTAPFSFENGLVWTRPNLVRSN